jgi:hypothetical protein
MPLLPTMVLLRIWTLAPPRTPATPPVSRRVAADGAVGDDQAAAGGRVDDAVAAGVAEGAAGDGDDGAAGVVAPPKLATLPRRAVSTRPVRAEVVETPPPYWALLRR